MTQEVEIEYKTLLTKEEYKHLEKELPFPNDALRQTNHYFDTYNFTLRNSHCALRIREKNGTYTLTFKQPHKEGILETKNKVTKEQFLSWQNDKPTVDNIEDVVQALREFEIDVDSLRYYGSLTTDRKKFTKDDITYVIDISRYNQQIDYELEIEATTKQRAEETFLNVLETYHIQRVPTLAKIERFYRSRT